jgi:DNA (cytosine-5)-methyltransferase 1
MQPSNFKFIDLFAGIGGMRIPFDAIGGQCVFTSELDPAARTVYASNFDCNHEFNDDITKFDLNPDAVPSHDLLLAGFPCQPFSNAGKRLGFEDTRGTLFFSIANIIRAKQPRVVLLENVRGLKSHAEGQTFSTIVDVLVKLGYSVSHSVLNARDYGLPQNRSRLFIVAIRNDIPLSNEYVFPRPTHNRSELKVKQILQEQANEEELTISDRLWGGHQERKSRNKASGKGFGYQMVNDDSQYTATLSARYYKDGSEILLSQLNRNPRLLSAREAANLQGFPSNFVLHQSRKNAYKQLGNAVPVNVIRALALSLEKYLDSGVS